MRKEAQSNTVAYTNIDTKPAEAISGRVYLCYAYYTVFQKCRLIKAIIAGETCDCIIIIRSTWPAELYINNSTLWYWYKGGGQKVTKFCLITFSKKLKLLLFVKDQSNIKLLFVAWSNITLLTIACKSTCGFQSESKRTTTSAVARFIPSPPALVLRMNMNLLLSGELNSLMEVWGKNKINGINSFWH